jgi:hypothetical protein
MTTAAALSGMTGARLSLYLGGIAVIGVWAVPLIIAWLYDLPRKVAIAVLSIALVWTGVAWLAALVIAVAGAIRAPAPRKADSGSSPSPAAEIPRQRSEPARRRPEGTPRQVARQPEQVARQPERVPERAPQRVPERAPQRAYAGPPPGADERPPRRQPDRPEEGYDRPLRRASDGRHQR